ncbi:hypothetical protein C9426_29755 [Serratia sp. S1B]|nr:hypothetical protein C9426_29755 [Serratia sp. S1B]
MPPTCNSNYFGYMSIILPHKGPVVQKRSKAYDAKKPHHSIALTVPQLEDREKFCKVFIATINDHRGSIHRHHAAP